MALSYKKTYNNTARIGDKIFKFSPWTTKNEKDYLIAVESETNIDDKLLFDILIRPCLEEQNVVLTTNEQKMLMIEIRKKSLGSTFPMRYTCTQCNQVNDIDVSFDNIITFTPDAFHDVTSEDITFTFGNIASENLKSRLDSVPTNVDYAFTEFLLHIQSIEIEGKVEDTFTFDELKEFIEDIPTTIFDEVYKAFQEMKSKLEFSLKTICLVCGTENEIGFSHLPNFLWT
ncbi:MAG: T4 family baseplate hub assembly chaperone [Sulfuricurvum sp.]